MDRQEDWDDLLQQVVSAGLCPDECSFDSSGLCLDGSRTVTAYGPDGKHIVSGFIRTTEAE